MILETRGRDIVRRRKPRASGDDPVKVKAAVVQVK